MSANYEFRWLEKRTPKGSLVTSKLQYRVLEDAIDSDDYCCKAWSKWKDVPIVTRVQP